MSANLKVVLLVLGIILAYTVLASAIPQVESEVPQELSFSGTVTVEELVAAGEGLYNGAGGCTACHGLGTRAPNLLADEGGEGMIGVRCAQRVSGQDCKAYLHASLTDPGALVVAGYEPIMPDMRRTLSAAQIWALVAWLESQGGEVTVTAEDVADAAAEAPVVAPGAGGGALAGGSTDPQQIMAAAACTACHKLGEQGGAIGPPFDGMGTRIAADRIRRGILEPNADTAQGFASLAGTMPLNFGQQLNAAQLESLVQFLANRK